MGATRWRQLGVAAITALVAIAIAVGGDASANPLPTDVVTFTSSGEHQFIAPAGSPTIHVVAVGKQGSAGAASGGGGGRGAVVTADLTLNPGQSYFAFVNVGGGSGGPQFGTPGGAGGGASDLRGPADDSLLSRFLIAGGGGGGGANFMGGAGGAAATAGSAGSGSSKGSGGGAGTASMGGAGGAGGNSGHAGDAGTLGVGGAGGAGSGTVGSGGGGGGGGYFGGGGGGGVNNVATSSGGGGGGGSSFVDPSIAGATIATATTGTASITLSFPDGTAPQVSLNQITTPSTSTTPTFTGTGGTDLGDDATVTVDVFSGTQASGSPVQTLPATLASGSYTTSSSAPLADGTYTARASQADGAGNVGTSAVTFVVDTTAPTVSSTAPADGATYAPGQAITTAYSCQDGGSGVASCQGPVAPGAALDTSTLGPHTFTITTTDHLGNSGAKIVHYTVAAPPSVSVTTPKAGARYSYGQTVVARYACQESAFGLGLSACTGPVGGGRRTVTNGGRIVEIAVSGGTIDTSHPGPQSFTVTATSSDGQQAQQTVAYTVLPDNHFIVSHVSVHPDGSITFRIALPGPGQVSVLETASAKRAGKGHADHLGSARTHARSKRRGTLTLAVRLRAGTVRALQRAGAASTLLLRVSFTPADGTQRSVARGPFRLPRSKS